jgi:hypothetical protein
VPQDDDEELGLHRTKGYGPGKEGGLGLLGREEAGQEMRERRESRTRMNPKMERERENKYKHCQNISFVFLGFC